MRRLTRFLACSLAIPLLGVVLGSGAAHALTAAEPRTLGLGAVRPTDRLAPQAPTATLGRSALATLPTAVDLRRWAVTPGDQGSLSSCVPWAIDYAMLGWYSRYTGRTGAPFAPMYTYSQIHLGNDGGSRPVDALRLAVAQGNDTRADYPQGNSNWQTKPTAAQHTNAARYKIAGFTTLFMGANQPGTATALKQALSTVHPVAIEVTVRAGFANIGAGASAVDTDVSSPVLGYHEVLAVGYDAAGVIVQNSWGTSWAGDGFGRISWAVVQHDLWEADIITGLAPAPTAPTVSVPVAAAHAQNAGNAATASYTFTWKGTPGTSGTITRYDAWYQSGGGSLVPIRLASATATSLTLTGNVGQNYRVAVRARTGLLIGARQYSAIITA